MPLRNNTEITAAITDYINNSKATAARVADWIRLGEKRIIRSLSANGMLDKLFVTHTITTDTSPKSLPAGIRGLPEVVYLDTNPKVSLNYMTPSSFFRRWLGSETGKPSAFTVQGKKIHFGPTPDDSYSCVIWYRQEPDIARTLDQLLVPEMDETDFNNNPTTKGSFAGGTGHDVDDVLTMSDGSKVLVTSESGNVVDGFKLTETSSNTVSSGDTLTMSSSTGSGTGFTLTPEQDNLSNPILIDHPELYLYGAVAEGFLYLENSKRAAEFAGLFKEAIDTIEDEQFMSGPSLRQLQTLASAGAPHRPR